MLINAYKHLYRNCCSDKDFKGCAPFVAVKGKYYTSNSLRLLLVGRATNGWGSIETVQSETSFLNEVCTQINESDGFSWIENQNKVLRIKGNTRYSLSRSSFWNYAKDIWMELLGGVQNGPVWMNNIAWTNLYKLAPVEKGNPSAAMKEKQSSACVEILHEEIKLLNPTHILIMSGYDWFRPFEGIFQNVIESEEKNHISGRQKNQVYVEGVGDYNDIPVVITCRPELRSKDKFVEQTVHTLLNKYS